MTATAIAAFLTVPHAARARPIAYVANHTSGAVTELNTSRQDVAATIPLSLAFERRYARVSPNGKRLYISGPDTLSVVDITSRAVIDTVQREYCNGQGCPSGAFDISPDGAFLYLTTFAVRDASLPDFLTVIDTSTDRTVASIPLGNGQHAGAVVAGSNGLAYVALESSKSIAVVDIRAGVVTQTIALSRLPAVLAVTPDGRFAYAGTYWNDSAVEVIDIGKGRVIANLPVARVPQGIAATADGRSVYVASTSGVVTVIDTVTNEIVATIPAPGAQQLVLSPDASFAYVSDYDAGRVLVIDTRIQQVTGAVPTGPIPLALAVSPGGEQLYAVTPWVSPAVSVIDTAALQVVATVPEAYRFESVVLRPDGRFAYLTTNIPNGGAVLVLDTAANRLVASIPLHNPTFFQLRAAITPDGRLLYVGADPLMVIDTASNTIVASIPLPGMQGPVGVAFAPDGRNAYVLGYPDLAVDGGHGGQPYHLAWLSVIDVATASVVNAQPVDVDGLPSNVAVTPDGTAIYVSLHPPPVPHLEPPRPGALAILDLQTFAVLEVFPYSSERVVFSPDGRLAYAVTSNDGIAVIDTAARAITAWVDPVFAPEGIAIRPDGAFLYVTGFGSSVAVVDTRTVTVATSVFVGGLTGDIAVGETADLPCPGDCNGNGRVTIDELVSVVNVMLGLELPSSCRNLETDTLGAVRVSELVRAVVSVMEGCAGSGQPQRIGLVGSGA